MRGHRHAEVAACGRASTRIHTRYRRCLADLPAHDETRSPPRTTSRRLMKDRATCTQIESEPKLHAETQFAGACAGRGAHGPYRTDLVGEQRLDAIPRRAGP